MKILLKNVRITFPNLWEAKQVNGQGEAKYSAGFLIDRKHPQLGDIVKAVEAVAQEEWGTRAGEVLASLKAADKLPVHDGDAKADYPGYKGMLFINASNKIRPLVIDQQRSPLTQADGKPYSGCYVDVSLDFWAQDNKFGKRVNASLLGVQFRTDGERLAGGSVASADDFEAIDVPKESAQGGGAAALFG